MSPTEWSELGVSGLPTGTVTLLLADVEGSTRLWETEEEPVTVVGEALGGGFADSAAGAGDQHCLRDLAHGGVAFR